VLKTPKEASLDVYYDLLAHDPNERYSGLSENDVEELRQIMTEMDGVEVTPEVAWSTARAVLELVRVMLEHDIALNTREPKAGSVVQDNPIDRSNPSDVSALG